MNEKPNTKSTKPKIELKALKYMAALSEETHCFNATLYVDGKRFARISNRGHGADDDVHAFDGGYAAVRELETRIKETYPRQFSEQFSDLFPDGMEPSLESIVCDLVNEALAKSDFKKRMKKICYVKEVVEGAALYVLPAKWKPTAENMAKVRLAKWADGVTFLNDLPEEEAFKIFQACA